MKKMFLILLLLMFSSSFILAQNQKTETVEERLLREIRDENSPTGKDYLRFKAERAKEKQQQFYEHHFVHEIDTVYVTERVGPIEEIVDYLKYDINYTQTVIFLIFLLFLITLPFIIIFRRKLFLILKELIVIIYHKTRIIFATLFFLTACICICSIFIFGLDISRSNPYPTGFFLSLGLIGACAIIASAYLISSLKSNSTELAKSMNIDNSSAEKESS